MYSIMSFFSNPSRNRNKKDMLFFIVLVMGLIFSAVSFAQTTLPLVQLSDLEYLGSFALPDGESYGTSNFKYGSHGVTPYNDPSTGKKTLFLEGHPQNRYQVAQVEIPSSFVKSTNWGSLPKAKVLQNFADVTDGKISTSGITSYDGGRVYGMLPYNGRLIVAVSEYYGSTQSASHGVSSLSLSDRSDFSGFYSFNASAPPRALGGSMTTIPSEWQTLFGGPALTGNWAIPVIGSNSAGPALTVFNPDDVGAKNPIPGTTMLYYPIEHPLRPEASQNNYFNLATHYGGVAFPAGSRSLLFFGRHGTGPYCYGTSAECEPQYSCETDNKGPHSPPYRFQVWAYDANHLLDVKNGQKQSWEPQPYGIWELAEITNGPCNNTWGAGYDPPTGRMFIAIDSYEKPIISVYQIKASAIDDSKPNPPSNLRVIQ